MDLLSPPNLNTPTRPTLCLAGTPQLRAGDGRLSALAPRDAALLAWLALEGPTSRGRLAALLWPDSDAAQARNALRQRLFHLRRLAGAELVLGVGVLALAEGVAHDLDAASGLLGETEHGYGAEFAAWLTQHRLQRQERRQLALIAEIEAAERRRDYAEALARSGELLRLDPLSEASHRRLMRLHYLAGDRAAALLAFDRCEQLLKHEVGARPGAETLALLDLLERAQPLLEQPRAMPPAMLRPPRLLGRDRELQAARAAWRRGQVLSLHAEAGLGKTRLLQELAAAQAGAVYAQARPGDRMLPYASFARLLRALLARLQAPTAEPLPAYMAQLGPLLPELAAPAGSSAARIAAKPTLLRAVAQLLRTALQQGVAVLLFDDLHDADDASVDLLMALLQAGESEGLASLRWALAQRPAEADPALLRLHDGLADAQALCSIGLPPLDEPQLRELVASLGIEGVDVDALAARLLRLTGGNPLFALETLRLGHEEAQLDAACLPRPASVTQLIGRRLHRLSAPALRLARCAAVAGQDFDAELAAQVLGVEPLDLADAWGELEAAQVLRGDAFAHDLIFDAVLASVPAPLAEPLHAQIAGRLAQRSGAHAVAPGRVAQHWERARRWAEAATAYVAAADLARDAGRRIEEAELLERAAQGFEQAGDADARFEALLRRADVLGCYEMAGRAEASIASVDAAAADQLQRLRAQLVRVQSNSKRSEIQETLTLAPAGMEQARALGRMDLVLAFAIPLSEVLCDLRRAGEALALLAPLSDWVAASAGAEEGWRYWSARALACDYDNALADAALAWQEALAIARRLGRNDLIWQTLHDLGSTQAKRGQVRLSVELGLQALSLAREPAEEGLGRLYELQMVLGHRLRDTGRYAQAVSMLEQTLAFFRRTGVASAITSTENRLAQTFLQLGQPARAQALLATEHGAAFAALGLVRLLLQAETARLSGGDALTPIRAALARTPDRDDVYYRLAALFASAIVPAEEGEGLATGVAAWASVHQRLGMALAGHVRAAGCALAQQAVQRAIPHVEAALRLARDYEPDSFYLPELWLTAARVFLQAGAEAEAAAALRDGLAWLRRVADEEVPAAFRDSFLQRNPVNRDLLALAAQHARAA